MVQQLPTSAKEIPQQAYAACPQEGTGRIGDEKARPRHTRRSGGQAEDDAQTCDEPPQKDCPCAVALEIDLGGSHRAGRQEEQSSGLLKSRARQSPAQPEAGVVSGD